MELARWFQIQFAKASKKCPFGAFDFSVRDASGFNGGGNSVGRYQRPRNQRPLTSCPKTPRPYAAHSREPATPRPYRRAVGLRSLRLGTAGEWDPLICTFPGSSIRPTAPVMRDRGRDGWGLWITGRRVSASSSAIEAHDPVKGQLSRSTVSRGTVSSSQSTC